MEKENNEMILSDITNYRHNIDNSLKNVISLFCSLIERFLDKCGELTPKKDKIYIKYIVRKGIEIINHVFMQCLIYTKNLELTFQTTQSAFLYYCEFMNQIGNENHSYLKLSVKDATLFVYKKTIFEINHNMRKNNTMLTQDIELVNNFKNFLSLSNGILFNLLEYYKFLDNSNILELCIFIKENILIIYKRITVLYDEYNENILKDNEINICLKLAEEFRLKVESLNYDIIKILPYLEGLLRKFKKSNSIKKNILKNFEEIRNKLITEEFYDVIQNENVNYGLLYLLKLK